MGTLPTLIYQVVLVLMCAISAYAFQQWYKMDTNRIKGEWFSMGLFVVGFSVALSETLVGPVLIP